MRIANKRSTSMKHKTATSGFYSRDVAQVSAPPPKKKPNFSPSLDVTPTDPIHFRTCQNRCRALSWTIGHLLGKPGLFLGGWGGVPTVLRTNIKRTRVDATLGTCDGWCTSSFCPVFFMCSCNSLSHEIRTANKSWDVFLLAVMYR